MAVHDAILERFKDYSLINKSSKNEKEVKKGFSTTHNEVKYFVEGLVAYLLN